MNNNIKEILCVIAILSAFFCLVGLYCIWHWNTYHPYELSIQKICLEQNMTGEIDGFVVGDIYGECIGNYEIIQYKVYNGTWRKLK